VVVDASVWVSWLVPADVNNAVSQRWLRQQFQDPAFVPVVPTLALVEVTSAVARRTGLTVDGEQAMAAVGQLPRLQVVTLDLLLADEAGRAGAG
jgi:predicted nucleic acid-binding protein